MSSALELDGQRQSHSLHVTRLWPRPGPSSVRGTGICTLSCGLPSLFRSMDVSPSPLQGPASRSPSSPKPGTVSARYSNTGCWFWQIETMCNRDASQRSCTNQPSLALRQFGSANIGLRQSNDARLRLSPCSAAETASMLVARVGDAVKSAGDSSNWIDSKHKVFRRHWGPETTMADERKFQAG